MSYASEGGVLSKSYDKEVILQNARQLLLTRPGQRVMYPEFGIGMDRFLFEPITASLMQEMEALIRTQFEKFEPRLVIKDLSFGSNTDAQAVASENSSVFIKLHLGFTNEFFEDQMMEVIVK